MKEEFLTLCVVRGISNKRLWVGELRFHDAVIIVQASTLKGLCRAATEGVEATEHVEQMKRLKR